MSRLRVKAILDNAPHLLEVDRRSVTFDSLNSEISGKLKIGNAYTLIYQAPTGIQYQISDDASLQRAITESTKAGARSLDLKVLRTGASSGCFIMELNLKKEIRFFFFQMFSNTQTICYQIFTFFKY